MKLAIRIHHIVVTPETIAEIRKRLSRAFERVVPWVRVIDVTVVDINGRKGGADKHCRLRLRGDSIPTVVVEHLGVDTVATVALAAQRAEQVVLRRLARRRGFAPQLAC